MKKINKKLLALLWIAAAGRSILAWAAYDDIGVGARVVGMGNAFTAVADDVYSIYYNPAGLATLDRPELALSYSKLLGGLSDNSNLQNSFLAYSHPLRRGEWGTAGLAWNQFTLDNFYRETMIYGSYGSAIFERAHPKTFYAGVNLKYLHRALGSVGAASQPLNQTGQVIPNTTDPVLQNGGKSNIDVDLGFLYRVRPRWTLGLMLQHVMEPDIAFSSSDPDKLGRNVKLGGSYKTPFSTLSSDLVMRSAPDGSTDKIVSLAAEKWLPTLLHGSFGLRGGIGMGSRDYRQITMGLSYKIHRMQFDYGLLLPFGNISGTFGTHRLGITFRFGRARGTEASYAEAILENMQELSEIGSPEFQYQMRGLERIKRVSIETLLKHARKNISEGRFTDALGKLNQAVALNPGDPKLIESQARLKIVAEIYPEFQGSSNDAAQAALYKAIVEFVASNDKTAWERLSYALRLIPSDPRLLRLKQAVVAKANIREQVSAPSEAAGSPETSTGAVTGASARPKAEPTRMEMIIGYLSLMDVAFQQGEYDKVLELGGRVLGLDPKSLLAYKLIGAVHSAKKRYPEALKAFSSAYDLENDPDNKRMLRVRINVMRELVRQESPRPAEGVRPAGPAPALTPQEIERLYEAGVDLYARGKLSEAEEKFKQILEVAPNNLSARRALDRVQAEIQKQKKATEKQ